jgi:hypothetical protein
MGNGNGLRAQFASLMMSAPPLAFAKSLDGWHFGRFVVGKGQRQKTKQMSNVHRVPSLFFRVFFGLSGGLTYWGEDVCRRHKT